MPGLVPGIHVLNCRKAKTWMAGTSPSQEAFAEPLDFLADRIDAASQAARALHPPLEGEGRRAQRAGVG